MSAATDGEAPGNGVRWPAVAVFFAVLGLQLMLVRVAGTDVPFQDQWDVEGRRIYPLSRSGELDAGQLFVPHNEHRIAWSHLLNLALFELNGEKWDPLVQQVAGAFLHAAFAALLMGFSCRGCTTRTTWLIALAVVALQAPVAAWHNALWGFQSHVYFVLLFSIAALGWLATGGVVGWRRIVGWIAAGAGLLASGISAFVPLALLIFWVLQRDRSRPLAQWALGAALFAAALLLRTEVPEHAAFRASNLAQFVSAFGRMAAWPHVEQPVAGVVTNLPLLVVIGGRLLGRIRADARGDFPVALGIFGLLVAAGSAWARGGGDEFAAGLPSRYVDFAALLPLANVGCLVCLAAVVPFNRVRGLVAVLWVGFVLLGLIAVSAEAMRRIILPRAHDRDAPVRLLQSYQATRDENIYGGVPRLLVPHPNLRSVDAVLDDPRMKGALPPSLQTDQPMGPLSQAVRW